MPLGIKKEAFLLNESDKQRLIEPLYKLYETTQKQHEPHRVRVVMLIKKKTPPKTVEKADEHKFLIYLIYSQLGIDCFLQFLFIYALTW